MNKQDLIDKVEYFVSHYHTKIVEAEAKKDALEMAYYRGAHTTTKEFLRDLLSCNP